MLRDHSSLINANGLGSPLSDRASMAERFVRNTTFASLATLSHFPTLTAVRTQHHHYVQSIILQSLHFARVLQSLHMRLQYRLSTTTKAHRNSLAHTGRSSSVHSGSLLTAPGTSTIHAHGTSGPLAEVNTIASDVDSEQDDDATTVDEPVNSTTNPAPKFGYAADKLEAERAKRLREREKLPFDPRHANFVPLTYTNKDPVTVQLPNVPFRVGFIGLGSVGSCILKCLLDSGCFDPSQIFISTRRPELHADKVAKGMTVDFDNQKVANSVHLLFLTCLPTQLPLVVDVIGKAVTPWTSVFAIQSGVPVVKMRSMLVTELVCRPYLDRFELLVPKNPKFKPIYHIETPFSDFIANVFPPSGGLALDPKFESLHAICDMLKIMYLVSKAYGIHDNNDAMSYKVNHFHLSLTFRLTAEAVLGPEFHKHPNHAAIMTLLQGATPTTLYQVISDDEATRAVLMQVFRRHFMQTVTPVNQYVL